MEILQVLAALGGMAFMLASLVLGGRLILLSRRSHQLPELLLGATLFLWAGIGYPLMMVGQLGKGLPDAVREAFVLASLICAVVGLSCIALFTWRVFRPAAGWARWAAFATPPLVGVVVFAQVWQPGLLAIAEAEISRWTLLQQGLTPLLSGWASLESLLYFGRMRRRLRLGIADPVVTDRFRLWSIGLASSTVIGASGAVFALVGVHQSSALYQAVVGPFGMISAISMWLAFFPPRAYERRVLARAATRQP